MNKTRQEKIKEKILNIIQNESKKYREVFLIIIWLMTLFVKIWWTKDEIINEIKKQKTRNELYFDLGIYFNFLTDEDLWEI